MTPNTVALRPAIKTEPIPAHIVEEIETLRRKPNVSWAETSPPTSSSPSGCNMAFTASGNLVSRWCGLRSRSVG
jgi:hypothetical protein